MFAKEKTGEIRVLLLLLFSFKRDSSTFKVQYFTSESTQQQHNNTLGTPIHSNGHTFG